MINEIQLIRDLEHMKEKEDLGVPCSIDNIIALVEKQPKVNEWIPVDNELPKEKERNGEELSSDVVLVTLYDYIEDIYYVHFDYTINGQWSIELLTENYKVIAWMPLPVPYGGNEDE